MPSSLKIKERIQKRKIELNQIKQCLNQAIEFMEGCEYSSNLTANLINDLLDFANTEKLCSKISKEWFNLGETIENAFNVLRFESKRKGIALKLSVPYNNLTSFNQIYSDESRFLQILLNLLSNSLKYTPNNGHIEVKLITCENIQMSDSFAFDLDLNDGEL
jgi:signal transduction histidine kinase